MQCIQFNPENVKFMDIQALINDEKSWTTSQSRTTHTACMDCMDLDHIVDFYVRTFTYTWYVLYEKVSIHLHVA